MYRCATSHSFPHNVIFRVRKISVRVSSQARRSAAVR